MENKRALGIVKNKDHKTFVVKFLQEAVKTHNLIPPCSVIKSPAFLEWERAHVGNSMAAPRQAAMKQPLVEHVSMPLLVGPPSGSPHDQDPNSDHDNSAITESGSVWGICVEVGDWHTESWTEESPIMQGWRAVGSSGMQDAGV